MQNKSDYGNNEKHLRELNHSLGRSGEAVTSLALIFDCLFNNRMAMTKEHWPI